MDYKRREEIFSKEAIHYTEMAELLGCDKSTAGRIIRDMKRQVGDILGIQGRIHILDYLKWLEHRGGEFSHERYVRPEDIETTRKLERLEKFERTKEAATSKSVFTTSSAELQKKYGSRRK